MLAEMQGAAGPWVGDRWPSRDGKDLDIDNGQYRQQGKCAAGTTD